MAKLTVEYEVIKIETRSIVGEDGEVRGNATVTLRGPVGTDNEREAKLSVGDKFPVELDLDKAVTITNAPEPTPEEEQ